MPAAMTATPRCCWARPSTSPRRATSTARCTSSSSRPRKVSAAPRRWSRTACSGASPATRSSACTTGPGMPLGKFAVRSGPMMAGGAFFDIDIKGRGAHGARPEAGVDPVLVASHVTAALQSIVARNVRPVDTAVLSVTQIHGGDAYNVIPQTARLSGTVRAFSNEVMALIGRNHRARRRGRGGRLRREGQAPISASFSRPRSTMRAKPTTRPASAPRSSARRASSAIPRSSWLPRTSPSC